MASDKGVVHVIDDDEASRQSLAFLLQSAKIDVQTHASAAIFLDRASRPECRLHRYRRADARP